MTETAAILLCALVLDWFFGEPDWLWRRLPHPVIVMGKLIEQLDHGLNRRPADQAAARRNGVLALGAMAGAALLAGWALSALIAFAGPFGAAIEIVLVFTLLAQKSLKDHVGAVATAGFLPFTEMAIAIYGVEGQVVAWGSARQQSAT